MTDQYPDATKIALQVLAAKAARLEAALQQIADGNVMTGTFTHLETVLRYQEIARDALDVKIAA